MKKFGEIWEADEIGEGEAVSVSKPEKNVVEYQNYWIYSRGMDNYNSALSGISDEMKKRKIEALSSENLRNILLSEISESLFVKFYTFRRDEVREIIKREGSKLDRARLEFVEAMDEKSEEIRRKRLLDTAVLFFENYSNSGNFKSLCYYFRAKLLANSKTSVFEFAGFYKRIMEDKDIVGEDEVEAILLWGRERGGEGLEYFLERENERGNPFVYTALVKFALGNNDVDAAFKLVDEALLIGNFVPLEYLVKNIISNNALLIPKLVSFLKRKANFQGKFNCLLDEISAQRKLLREKEMYEIKLIELAKKAKLNFTNGDFEGFKRIYLEIFASESAECYRNKIELIIFGDGKNVIFSKDKFESKQKFFEFARNQGSYVAADTIVFYYFVTGQIAKAALEFVAAREASIPLDERDFDSKFIHFQRRIQQDIVVN